MQIGMIGLDFRSAPLVVRERLTLTRAEALELLRRLRRHRVLRESLVLSTCNRTELYFAGPADGEDVSRVLEHLAAVKGDDAPAPADVLQRLDGLDAVRRLFRVAASLDSQIIGEQEILSQVKDAYTIACDARSARFALHKLLHAAFRTAKRVHAETLLGRGTCSVAQAAVDLAAAELGGLDGRTVMLLGAGQTAKLAGRAAVDAGAGRIVIVGRTRKGAERLGELLRAGDCPARGDERPTIETVTTRGLASRLGCADAIICATSSKRPVLTAARHGEALAGRGRPVCVCDIAVPRDVEPAVGEIATVRLHNIDELDAQVARNLRRREREIPRAEAIVAEQVDAFARWMDSLQVVPTIKRLQARGRTLADREAERYAGRLDAEPDELARFARALCRKLLHDPVAYLKDLSRDGGRPDDLEAVDQLRRMFALDEEGEG